MYCRSCRSEVNENSEYCMNCGKKPLNGIDFCHNCGTETTEGQKFCLECGVNLKNLKKSSTEKESNYHCRHCGNEVNGNAEICVNCGRRPLTGNKFCQNCGNKTTDGQEICTNCGVRLQSINYSNKTSSFSSNNDEVNGYYQTEFQKIKSSNEAYKGKWNWAAFFFGPLWAMYKGMWGLGLIGFAIGVILSQTVVIPFIVSIFFASRGNYSYYRLKEYGEVSPNFKELF